jgi:hypothetical protein
MAPTKRIAGFVDIFGSHQQLGAADRGVHSARIIGPDHRLDPDFVEDALGYLSVRRGPERRDGD